MKKLTIIILVLLILFIIGIISYMYLKYNIPINKYNNSSGLDKIERAINDKLDSSQDNSALTGMDKIEEAINQKLDIK